MRVLLIEDAASEAELIRGFLASPLPVRYRLVAVSTLARGLARLRGGSWDAVLLDLNLPDSRGIESLKSVRKAAPLLPVVVLTGLDENALAVEAVREGAQDYVLKKQMSPRLLDRVLRSARERHRLFMDLERRCATEAERGRLRAQLGSLVNHEFANTMSVVQCALCFLEETEKPSRSGSRRQMYDIIRKNVQALDLMATNLLNLGRLESGKLRLRPERVDVAKTARECLDRVRALCRKKRLRAELDAPAEPLHARADPEALSLAVSNLVMNAAKYTPSRGRIRLRASRSGGEIRVSCEDTGIGMTPSERKRVFSGFFRGARARRAAAGFGVGLVLVRSIVELHGSRLRVRSARGKGSSFSFRLPLWNGAR